MDSGWSVPVSSTSRSRPAATARSCSARIAVRACPRPRWAGSTYRRFTSPVRAGCVPPRPSGVPETSRSATNATGSPSSRTTTFASAASGANVPASGSP